MKKRLFLMFIAFVCILSSFNAFADEEQEYYRLNDTAELMSEADKEQIMAKLDEISEKHGMDIAVLTVEDVEEGLTPEQDATEWYEYLNYSTDGVMLYVSAGSRDWYMVTSGFCITAITDAGIEYISEKFLTYLSQDDYTSAFDSFISYTDQFIEQAKTGKPYDVGHMPKEPYSLGMSLVISLAIGFIVSLIITGSWKSKLKSVAQVKSAANYIKPDSLNITASRDFFLYRHVDRRAKEKDSDGGSTTHKSSSGRTYGGGGGKF